MQIVFLLSYPRSGSTLLQCILATHPQIDTRPEDCRLTGVLKCGGRVEQWMARDIPARSRNSDGYWLEKDAFAYRYAQQLPEKFPDCKIIWLTRKPEDCISSYAKLFKRPEHGMRQGMQRLVMQWREFNFIRDRVPGLAVDYAGLIADPMAEAIRIQNYLEIEPLCSADPADFDSTLALNSKVKHPEVLEPIKTRPSKLGTLSLENQTLLRDLIRGPNSANL